jgi:DNA-binding transcriptional LysR family regulator
MTESNSGKRFRKQYNSAIEGCIFLHPLGTVYGVSMPAKTKISIAKSKILQRRHIAALVSIGESLSVHAAARDIGMPQPALSRLLSEAEQLLGARLFERSSHGCRPTPDGQIVLAQARFVMRGLDELGSILSDTRPVVRLGCIPRAMYTIMPRLLDLVYPFRQEAEESSKLIEPYSAPFELNAVEGNSTELMDGLRQGKLDFAIFRSASSSPNTESSICIERLYDDKIVIICSAENTKLIEKAVPLQEISTRDWLLPDIKTTSRQAFDNFLREHDLAPIKPIMEVRSFEANLALVAGTRFLSIAPESIARRYSKMGLRVVRTKPALPSSPVMLAYHSSQLQSLTLKSFYDVLIQAAASSYPG